MFPLVPHCHSLLHSFQLSLNLPLLLKEQVQSRTLFTCLQHPAPDMQNPKLLPTGSRGFILLCQLPAPAGPGHSLLASAKLLCMLMFISGKFIFYSRESGGRRKCCRTKPREELGAGDRISCLKGFKPLPHVFNRWAARGSPRGF